MLSGNLNHDRLETQGLKLLCGLLFGERPGGSAAQDALPPPGRGLQLSGNRDAYYDANNSLLHRFAGIMFPWTVTLLLPSDASNPTQ